MGYQPLPHPHLHADLSLNSDAIAAAAQRSADHAMLRPTAGCTTTWQQAYDRAHARLADVAQGHRATALWRIEQDDEDARRAAMTPRERRILDLRIAAHLAPMIDCTVEAIEVRDGAERELAALMKETV